MRWVARLAAVLGGLVLLAAAAIAGVLWLSLPADQVTAAIAGLSAPVNISFDQDGIPRIQAANPVDAAAALGFVHARDRMFEMDLMRRAASGRLSEIAGQATLPLDRMMRTLGLRQAAVADYPALKPDTRALLEAYSRGVNAWIALKGRFASLETVALGAPEPWTPVDCLLWGKTMGMWLSSNYRVELARQGLVDVLSPAQIDALWPPDHTGGHPEASLSLAGPSFAWLDQALPKFPQPFTLPESASNEWAVDGHHTASGAPLLAGDPHLAFGQPGIWYLARIATPLGVLAGATSPGVPFLVIGHNGHVAWTFTTTGADVQDLFTETLADATHYMSPTGPLPFTLREERIGVRGLGDVVMTVRSTRHGPVISDLAPAASGAGHVLALQAVNLMPGDTAADGLLALNNATTVADAQAAAPMISSPVQNLLVADHQAIALFETGRVPIRRAGDGAAPVAGADGGHDWTGFASGDQLPHVIAPASGRLVNGNERVAPPNFPIFLGRDWFGDWRASRIRAMLDGQTHLTVADFAAMQLDVKSTFADRLLPVLRGIVPPAGPARAAASLLASWDGSMARDRPEPLIFNAWLRRFFDLLLARSGLVDSAAIPQMEFLASVLAAPASPWCGGDCKPMLLDALQTSVAELARQYGNDPAAWRWGVAHQAVFANPVLAAIPVVGPLTTARIAAPGDDSTVDRGTMRPGGTDAVHGASFRGAFDLADLDASRFVVAPGQSGNPVSSHARDFIARWRDGGTVTLPAAPARVTATITLTPSP